MHFSWLSQDEVLSKAIFWKLHALFVILIPYNKIIKCYHSSCYPVFHTQQKFDPLRFSTENGKEMDPFAFLSFSAGPRWLTTYYNIATFDRCFYNLLGIALGSGLLSKR